MRRGRGRYRPTGDLLGGMSNRPRPAQNVNPNAGRVAQSQRMNPGALRRAVQNPALQDYATPQQARTGATLGQGQVSPELIERGRRQQEEFMRAAQVARPPKTGGQPPARPVNDMYAGGSRNFNESAGGQMLPAQRPAPAMPNPQMEQLRGAPMRSYDGSAGIPAARPQANARNLGQANAMQRAGRVAQPQAPAQPPRMNPNARSPQPQQAPWFSRGRRRRFGR